MLWYIALLALLGCNLHLAASVRHGKKTPITNSDSPDKDSDEKKDSVLLLLGKSGTGKSTLCQWLLANTSVCHVDDGLDSVTSEIEIATGSWFGEQSLGPLKVVDTPGFKDTNGKDAENWANTVKTLTEKVPEIDQIVLVTSYSREARREGEEFQVMAQLRASFGTDIWKHLVIFGRSRRTLGKLQVLCKPTKDIIWEMEAEHGWRAGSEEQIKEEVYGIPCYGAELVVEPADEDKEGIPMMSAVHPEEDPSRHSQYEIRQLVEMQKYVRARHHKMWELDVHPRFGPSEPSPDQNFTCVWPGTCELDVKGKHLSEWDQLKLFQMDDKACSEGHLAIEEGHHPVKFVKQDTNKGGNNKTQSFNLGPTEEPDPEVGASYKVCYCDYGACDTPERFGLDAGVLTIKPVTCPISACDEYVTRFQMEGHGSQTDCSSLAAELTLATYRKKVNFFCDSEHGYFVGNPPQAYYSQTCKEDGQLSKAPGSCRVVDCKDPPSISQAKLEKGSEGARFYGSQAQYKCVDDYTITGVPKSGNSFALRCDKSASWTSADGTTLDLADLLSTGCRRWKFEDWGECSNKCGRGTRTRSWQCDPVKAKCLAPPPELLRERCEDLTECIKCDQPPKLKHATLTNSPRQQLWQVKGDDAMYMCNGTSADDNKFKRSLSSEDRQHFPQIFTIDGSAKANKAESSKVKFKFKCSEVEGKGQWKLFDVDGKDLANELEENGCRRWELKDWGACSADCGTGSRHREVKCSTGHSAHCGGEGNAPTVLKTESCFGECTAKEKEGSLSAGLAPGRLSQILSAVFIANFLSQHHLV